MNLPNWSTNSHLRRVLHNMQADYTTIFGGRERELAELDAWLEDDANPYALLLAPTGRGKTALVWHWLLRQQHEWQVIFVPISIRYGNSNQADVLAALTHAFAQLHGELDEFNALQQTPSELRPKLAAYLRRELPDNTRVLLAIDGLDEATGWELGADLLPENPPANLKILLSARDMAQHQRADWYHKLGLQSEQTHDFTLGGLDRLALRELLIALGTPLDELAADFDVLGELLRVSAGDPVIVRLLVQLLREERIQIGQISQLPADDLNAVFALWLNQLSAQQSQHAQILLLLFANAYGPLSARDLLGLAPDHFADAEQIAHAIVPLARFVIGDAETGYVFSHQKLRELYRDRLDAQTLAEWNARFVNYGKQAYREPTPYLCRFLVNHLHDAGEWQFTRHLLADFSPQQAWAEARYALEGSYNGYLRDLDVLQNWAIAQNDLALNIHCTLIKSSIVSITSNLSGELLAYLVTDGTTKGKWSVETVLAHIEQQLLAPEQKLFALFAAKLPMPWERVFEIIKHCKYDRVAAYIALYPMVANDFKEVILQQIYQELKNDTLIKILPLLDFAKNLNSEWQTQLIECIFQADAVLLDSFNSDWQEILEATPQAWQTRMLELMQANLQHVLPDTPQHIHPKGKMLFSDVVSKWYFLPQDQQQILYWNDSLDIVLSKYLSKTVVKNIPESELQGMLSVLLQAVLSADITTAFAVIHNCLLLYTDCFPEQTQLLDIAIQYMFIRPQDISADRLRQLPPSYQEQVALHLMAQNTQDLCKELILCLEVVEHLRPQLISTILSMIPKIYYSQQHSHYLAILPYLLPEQRVMLVEQLFVQAKTIHDQDAQNFLKVRLAALQPIDQFCITQQTLFPQLDNETHFGITSYHYLLEQRPDLSDIIYKQIMSLGKFTIYSVMVIDYFTQDQQPQFAQTFIDHLLMDKIYVSSSSYDYKDPPIATKIFPYCTANQQQQVLERMQQEPDTNLYVLLIHGLLSCSTFPHHTLVPYIQQVSKLEYRLHLLDRLLPLLTVPEQEQIQRLILATFQEMQQDQIRIHYRFSPEIVRLISTQLLQNIEQNLDLLCKLYPQHNPNDQQYLRAHIWDFVTQQLNWSIEQIVEHAQLFEICVSYFTPNQIQVLVEQALTDTNQKHIFVTLIPYLTPHQLTGLLKLTPHLTIYDLRYYYQTADVYHQVLDQPEYYNTLIAALHTQQQYHCDPKNYEDPRDVMSVLNSISSELHDHDVQTLYQQSIDTLTVFFQIGIHPDTIEQLQRTNLINLQTMLHITNDANHKKRNHALYTLADLLPAYLQTLSLDEQQQLAAQIYRSVEQVSTAWP